MLRTALCDLLRVEHPIVQAGMGPFGSGARLAAAVSEAGALGTLGAAVRPVEQLREELTTLRGLTERPFVVNFTQPWLQQEPEAFQVALEAEPAAVSLALGDPGDLVARAHDAGVLFVQQVHTVEQAEAMAERGVDVLVAQGTEAGGFTGEVAMTVLVRQVVDAVSPVPVVAAGGIADGRGLAAALVLGASGVNVGTRFLAAEEAALGDGWKRALVEARAQDAVKVTVWDDIFPKPGGGAFDVVPRALRTPFVESWQRRPDDAAAQAETLREAVLAAVQEGRMEEYVPFTGQTVGLIREVLPAATIVQRFVEEAEEALRRADALRG